MLWNILGNWKAWARIAVWWNNDSNEEEKGNWDSNQISVVVSDVFKYFNSKNSTYTWVYFFAPHLTRQRKFYAAFFSKLRKSHKAVL